MEVANILMTGYTDAQLLDLMERWVDTSPVIDVGGLQLSIERVCDITNCSKMRSTNEPASASVHPTLIPTMISPIIGAILLIGAIALAIVFIRTLLKKKRCRYIAILAACEQCLHNHTV